VSVRDPRDVLLSPVISEKSYGLLDENQYTFVDGDAPQTKAALATLEAITSAKRVLVVLDREDVLNWVSLRNVPQVHLIEAGQLNTYDVLVADEVVFTEAALA
jgi:large subunit ribosomal protein L4